MLGTCPRVACTLWASFPTDGSCAGVQSNDCLQFFGATVVRNLPKQSAMDSGTPGQARSPSCEFTNSWHEYLAAYQYSRLETFQGWTLKAFLRPYDGLIMGSLEPLAVHPWAQELWYAAILIERDGGRSTACADI